MIADIPVCQKTYGKKILLSLGGGTNTYALSGQNDGVAFADLLWGAFGPQTSGWLSAGKPRPFDGPNKEAVAVDGFDFDIEFRPTGKSLLLLIAPLVCKKKLGKGLWLIFILDNSVGYIACVNRLRGLFSSQAAKPYIITGAPQCKSSVLYSIVEACPI